MKLFRLVEVVGGASEALGQIVDAERVGGIKLLDEVVAFLSELAMLFSNLAL